jgi:preprotein translocase subunit SecD
MNKIEYLKDFRISFLLLLIALLAILDAVYGGPNVLHLGVEFIGGTQIPVQLEHSVDAPTMATLISTLQGRLSTFGLKQVSVEGVGDSEVYVTIASVSGSEVNSTISLIQSQGVFLGIVNGKEALNGSSLLSGSLGAAQPEAIGDNVSWAVTFYITQQAAESFSKAVFGQANKPLYMFLDRPSNAIVLINSSLLGTGASTFGANQTTKLAVLQQSVQFGNQTLPIEVYSPGAGGVSTYFALNKGKYKEVILANDTPAGIVANLTADNYTLKYVSLQDMTPNFISSFTGTASSAALDSWPAIGLLSAPVLSPGITNGSVGQSYEINGYAPPGISLADGEAYATNQSKQIVSILSGGSLPVHVIVGVPTTIPPTLGQHFELMSVLALVLAILAVSLTIAIRYRRGFLIGPIIFTTFAELFIIMSVIGLIGTIDLAAVAGMIAVVGTGVDAQIIITDEVLSGSSEHGLKLKLGNAFYIIWLDAILLVVAMLPLLFSSTLVTIIGFAESTILGVLFGAFITRPAYGAILMKHYSKPKEEEPKKA